METFVNIAFFVLVAAGVLVGGYFLLKKFDPTTAQKIADLFTKMTGR